MADTTDPLESYRQAVTSRPTDETARDALARALEREGKPAEAVAVLGEGLVNLTAHNTGALPCLCRRCIDPDVHKGETGGLHFVREFSVAKGRVLYFWVPEALHSERKMIARTVATRLNARLQPLKSASTKRAK